jgi:hypothetical protein
MDKSIAEIKNLSLQKAIYAGVTVGTLASILFYLIVEQGNFYSFIYPKLLLCIFLLIPSLSGLAYLYLLVYHRCGKCGSLWSLQKIGEVLVNSWSTLAYEIEPNKEQSKKLYRYKHEDYLLQYQCAACEFLQVVPKKRKNKEEINE